MSYFASCNGLQIVGGSLLVPRLGVWTADIELASDTNISGAATVVIGDLTLVGFIVRSDLYGGQVKARLVGGYGGWRAPVPPQGYGSPNGVELSTVLQDVADAVGEKINVVSQTSVGYGFARMAGPASDVLTQLVSQSLISGWYVDPDGVTQTSDWPTVVINQPFTPTDQDTAAGVVTIATEDYKSWLPGCAFSHPLLAKTYTSSGVIYKWMDDATMRFQVLTQDAAPLDRLLGTFQQLVRKELAPTRFFGRYEYNISNPSSTTIDGSPADVTLGLPELQAVPLVSSSLMSYTPPDGGKAHIMFVDGHPTKPVCVWTEASAINGPTSINLAPQGDGSNAVARVGDVVVVMFPPVMPIAGTLGGAPFIGVLTITTPALGAIQTGSPTVSST